MKWYEDWAKYENCFSGHNYALAVISGDIPACKYVVGACRRYLKDIDRSENDPDCLFYFDPEKAERYLRLTQLFSHVKGRWPTPNIEYSPWQCFVFMNIMGWIDVRTRERRFRNAYIEVGRGNGKSANSSQCALFFLALDNPKGNTISCVANKSDQARLVLDSSRAMASANPKFIKSTGVEVLAHKITHDKSNSVIKALSSDAKSLDGLADVLAILDELHQMPQSLYDVISSGLAKRNDSLMLCITTAGFNHESAGFFQSQIAKKICTGEHFDDSTFAIVYTLDPDDDVFDERNWIKANPNYGISVDPIKFRAMAEKAKAFPSELSNFKVKNLCMWLSEKYAFFDPNAFDRCADPSLSIDDFVGEKCYVGIDLGSTTDLTVILYMFKRDGTYYMFARSFIPEETAKKSSSPLYNSAIHSGHLIATPGEAIHLPRIKEDFIDGSRSLKVISAFYDPWSATQFAQECVSEKINMVEFRQIFANLSEPTKAMDALIREGRMKHNGDPVMRWCFSNMTVKTDAAGNVRPDKSNPKLKIDIAVAAIMALAGWLTEVEKRSVYEERDLIIL